MWERSEADCLVVDACVRPAVFRRFTRVLDSSSSVEASSSEDRSFVAGGGVGGRLRAEGLVARFLKRGGAVSAMSSLLVVREERVTAAGIDDLER